MAQVPEESSSAFVNLHGEGVKLTRSGTAWLPECMPSGSITASQTGNPEPSYCPQAHFVFDCRLPQNL